MDVLVKLVKLLLLPILAAGVTLIANAVILHKLVAPALPALPDAVASTLWAVAVTYAAFSTVVVGVIVAFAVLAAPGHGDVERYLKDVRAALGDIRCELIELKQELRRWAGGEEES